MVAVHFFHFIFNKRDDLRFETDVVEAIDARNATGTDAVDFHQLVSDDVDPYKVQTGLDERRLDGFANKPLGVGDVVFEYTSTGMYIGSEVTRFGLSPHGTQNFSVEQQDPNISILFDFRKVFLDHNRLPLRIIRVAFNVVIDQGDEIFLIPIADFDNPLSAEPLQRFDHHGAAEIINAFFQSGWVS